MATKKEEGVVAMVVEYVKGWFRRKKPPAAAPNPLQPPPPPRPVYQAELPPPAPSEKAVPPAPPSRPIPKPGPRTFVVTAATDSEVPKSGRQSKVEFWSDATGEDLTPAQADVREARFRTEYAKALREQVIQYREGLLKPFPDSADSLRRERAVVFDFKVVDVSYGSCIFSVEIVGIGSLIKYLYNDPDLVLAFIDAAAAPAFAASTGVLEDRLNVTTQVTEDLFRRKAMTSSQPASATPSSPDESVKPASPTVRDHVRVLLAHYPYLLPLVLAFAVLAVAYSGMSQERDRQTKREEGIDKRLETLLNAHEIRTKTLEETTIKLVEQLQKQAPACCTKVYVPVLRKPCESEAAKVPKAECPRASTQPAAAAQAASVAQP